MIKRICKNCKKTFYVVPSIAKIGKGKFCSRQCVLQYSWGKNHWAWKEGKTKDALGYIRAYKPNHPFSYKNGHILEHRLVMEKKLGRYLKPYEFIHHLNGIKDDNRLENLVLTNKNNHQRDNHPELLAKKIKYARSFRWKGHKNMSREERLAKNRIYSRNWRKNNPEKWKACYTRYNRSKIEK